MILEARGLVDRFGAQAVYGRAMSVVEMRSIVSAENVWRAYNARSNSDDWVEFSKQHPSLSSLLTRIEIEYGKNTD